MPVLQLVPILSGPVGGLVEPLGRRLATVFGMPVEVAATPIDVEVAYDGVRGQYNSRSLLAQLLAHAPKAATRILGLTGVDLYVPVLTFVFGEAELDGRAALVSSFRLDNELYGLPADGALLFERLVKEAVHELGHTFGLVHCHRDTCVMTSSTYVEGIDLKSVEFCDRCLRAVRQKRARLGA